MYRSKMEAESVIKLVLITTLKKEQTKLPPSLTFQLS